MKTSFLSLLLCGILLQATFVKGNTANLSVSENPILYSGDSTGLTGDSTWAPDDSLSIPIDQVIIDAGPDQFLYMPVDSIFLSAFVEDPYGQIINREWVQVEGESSAQLAGFDLNSTMVFNVFEGYYGFEFRAYDSLGNMYSDYVGVTVYSEPIDTIPPTDTIFVDAGPEQVLYMPVDSIFLSAFVEDPYGQIISREWVQVEGDSSAQLAGFDLNSTMVFNVFEGYYGFEFRAYDSLGNIYSDYVGVTVYPEPIDTFPPSDSIYVDAGPDQFLYMPVDSIFLSAFVEDPYGQIISREWVQVEGDSSAQLAGFDLNSTMVFNVFEGYFGFEFRAYDSIGNMYSDYVGVTVYPEPIDTIPPTDTIFVDAGPDQFLYMPVDSIPLSAYLNDPVNQIIEKEWVQTVGDTNNYILQWGENNANVYYVFEGYYGFEFRAYDSLGNMYSDYVGVTIYPEPVDTLSNDTIYVNAGFDQQLYMPVDSIFLAAYVEDPAGLIISMGWSQIAGDTTISIEQFENNAIILNISAGTFGFRFTAIDVNGGVYSDDVWLTIFPEPSDSVLTDTVIIDNRDEFITFQGTWETSTVGRLRKWGPDFRHDGNTNKGGSTAHLTYPVYQSVNYDVFAWWPGHRLCSSNTRIVINANYVSDTIIVNQRRNRAQWVYLGTYEFNHEVNINIDNYNTDGYVVVDAFKLQPVQSDSTEHSLDKNEMFKTGVLSDNESIEEKYNLVISPNPSKGSFAISIENNESAYIEIFDILSRKIVLKGKYFNNTILETNLPEGMYIIHTTIENKTYVNKLIIQ